MRRNTCNASEHRAAAAVQSFYVYDLLEARAARVSKRYAGGALAGRLDSARQNDELMVVRRLGTACLRARLKW